MVVRSIRSERETMELRVSKEVTEMECDEVIASNEETSR
jgi:hypothetical protein